VREVFIGLKKHKDFSHTSGGSPFSELFQPNCST
jgi:hypothetical protein